jgi:hypothetical protein
MDIEFPCFVYKDGGPYARGGGTFDYKLAENEQEHGSLLASGWFKSVPEAIAGVAELPVDEVSPPTRKELEAQATELGIAFDGRTTDKKLDALITDKLAS